MTATAVPPVSQTAVVVGVGPGLGLSLCSVLAEAGMVVHAAARDESRLAGTIGSLSPQVRPHACDAGDRASVDALFDAVLGDTGVPDLVIYNAGAFAPGGIAEIDPAEFERCWRVGCLGGFHVGQRAARAMLADTAAAEAGPRSILFTGATASLRGGARFANLAVPKFGLRALAQSMARELGPQGIHVGHVIVDGQIDTPKLRQGSPDRDPATTLDPDALARLYLDLHRQDPRVWTFELDARPMTERW
ncbi:MAG: SDR family NAD(P)-dependent oxidoreductase [Alphaproteobacteria bacterium]|jgi:NAD(P)-dependent dehydrogenase (short-subunit alcohol dehydrogenase family)|nr:SDR family NAD(P)-dependent oxidoreductase [Alphaproteobacteria bacterium]